jgi:hypothetical protein
MQDTFFKREHLGKRNLRIALQNLGVLQNHSFR